MNIQARLIRLGGEYERARSALDMEALARLEREIDALEQTEPELWPAPWLVRGRNVIRRARGQVELNV